MNEKDENISICCQTKPEAKLFEIKKWNPVALWTWDVECDICAICRMGIMGKLYLSIYSIKRNFQSRVWDVNRIQKLLNVWLSGENAVIVSTTVAWVSGSSKANVVLFANKAGSFNVSDTDHQYCKYNLMIYVWF